MKNKVIYILMTIIFFIMFVYSAIHIFMWFKDNKHTENVTEDILENIEVKEIITEENEKEIIESIDFENLKEKNNDTVAWLEVKGTNINYPVVQTKDNKYYLNHSFDKKYTDAGWVFLDYRNNINNLDKNTVIYAHARKDLSMFGTLKYTLKKDWYSNEDNLIIKLTTPEKELLFQVFSTYHIETEDYYITTNFNKTEEFKKFINTIKKRSSHNYNIDINENDYILTLSSCYTNDEKIVLHAKLIEKES